MRYYEVIYIANPNLEDESLSRLVGVTKEFLKKRNSDLLYEEVMGKKHLAYPVEKQRYGTYVLLQFKSNGAGNVQLNRDFELNDDILAHMIVTVDEEDIREAKVEDVAKAAVEEKVPVATEEAPAAAEAAPAEAVVEAEAAQDKEPVAEEEPVVEEEPAATTDLAGDEAPEAVASSGDEDPQPEAET